MKEWTAALRLSAEADLAIESQGPLDDYSSFRVHVPACAFEAMEIRFLQTQAEDPCRVLARKSAELPEGVMGAMCGLGHRMLQVTWLHDRGAATTLDALGQRTTSNTQPVCGHTAKAKPN